MAYPPVFKWPKNDALKKMSKKDVVEWMNEYRKNQGILDEKRGQLDNELEAKMATKKLAKEEARKAKLRDKKNRRKNK